MEELEIPMARPPYLFVFVTTRQATRDATQSYLHQVLRMYGSPEFEEGFLPCDEITMLTKGLSWSPVAWCR